MCCKATHQFWHCLYFWYGFQWKLRNWTFSPRPVTGLSFPYQPHKGQTNKKDKQMFISFQNQLCKLEHRISIQRQSYPEALHFKNFPLCTAAKVIISKRTVFPKTNLLISLSFLVWPLLYSLNTDKQLKICKQTHKQIFIFSMVTLECPIHMDCSLAFLKYLKYLKSKE